jgi:glucuronate isomerase
MRIAGENERFCSGAATPKEKFDAWARTLVQMPASPMQAWCRLELKRTFDIDIPLSPASADRIWEETSEMLARKSYRPREMLTQAGFEILCTTDDPADLLEGHHQLAQEIAPAFRIFPTFRPDAALGLHPHSDFAGWLTRLETASGIAITTVSTFLEALRRRYEMFHALGCRISDHGLEHCHATPCTDAEASRIFHSLRSTCSGPGANDLEMWRSWFMRQIAEWNAECGWTMLLHLGTRRNNNSRVYSTYGLDAGCDSIGDFPQGQRLVAFLDQLDVVRRLPRTILFNSNPRDTLMFATIAGSFFEEGVRGKVQHGPPWWFLDQAFGIQEHLNAQCAVGVLGTFVGMVTDSRSFLSFVRHGYFRRIVTLWLAEEVAAGRLDPNQTDEDTLCRSIFYNNARSFFDWQIIHENP